MRTGTAGAVLAAVVAVAAAAKGGSGLRSKTATGGERLTASESYVVTPMGPVQGLVRSNARVFLGMPFAMPPVNALRWQPPQTAVPWGPTVYQGIYDPPGCIQVCDAADQPPHVCPGATSEDCLYLSVWTPRLAAITEPLPVFVWIHGGAFKDGYGGGVQYGIVYDASVWVNTTRAIVVTINYRLGAMGFLYQGGNTTLQGNYGLMDQDMAVEWVVKNIAPFGGDPTRITIVGQSAGAMSVASHLSRTGVPQSFTGAIMHSEPFALPFRTPETGRDLSNVFAGHANCSDGNASANWTAVEACLRGLDSASLLAAQVAASSDVAANWQRILNIFVPWTPTYNTTYLPTSPLDAFQAGAVVDVPIMLGTVANESNLFINFAFTKPLGELEYYVSLGLILGLNNTAKITPKYPLPSPVPSDLRPAMSAIGTDALFGCPTRNATASVATTPGRVSPIYLYYYAHVESFNPAIWGTVYPFNACWPIVCHASDLIELFQPQYPQYGTNYTAAEVSMSTAIQWYWTNFAATGVPGAGNPATPLTWPAYNVSSRSVLYLQAGATSIVPDWDGAMCNFWDSEIGYDFY